MRPICFGKVAVAAAGTPVKMGQGTLSANMTTADETLTVTSSVGFCQDMIPFKMQIDPTGPMEIVVVKGISSNTFTIQRGMEGTTPVAHGSGAVVAAMFPFAGWDISPVSGGTGKVYWGEDTMVVSSGAGVIHELVPQSTAPNDKVHFLSTSQQGNPLNLIDYAVDVATSGQSPFVTLWER